MVKYEPAVNLKDVNRGVCQSTSRQTTLGACITNRNGNTGNIIVQIIAPPTTTKQRSLRAIKRGKQLDDI